MKKYAYTDNQNNVVISFSTTKPTAVDVIDLSPEQDECIDDVPGKYQAAWEIVNGKIEVNLDKAKVIKLAEIREIREIHLEQFDRLQARYIGSGDTDGVARCERRKEMLRDLPTIIDWDSITNMYELGQIRPPEITD